MKATRKNPQTHTQLYDFSKVSGRDSGGNPKIPSTAPIPKLPEPAGPGGGAGCNHILHSEDLTQAPWAMEFDGRVLNATQIEIPNFNTNLAQPDVPMPADEHFVLEVEFRVESGNLEELFLLTWGGGSVVARMNINLATASVISTSGGGVISATVEAIGGGWVKARLEAITDESRSDPTYVEVGPHTSGFDFSVLSATRWHMRKASASDEYVQTGSEPILCD